MVDRIAEAAAGAALGSAIEVTAGAIAVQNSVQQQL